MKISVCKALIDVYKESGKNHNYCLKTILDNLDYDTLGPSMKLVDSFGLVGEKAEVEIDDGSIKTISKLIGKTDDLGLLIEQLLWLALLFPEI